MSEKTKSELMQELVEARARQAELAENYTTFKALVENSHDGIVMLDTEVHFTYANQAAHLLFGCDFAQREMVGMDGARFWPEGDFATLREIVLPQALKHGWHGEVRQRRKDGSIFIADATFFAVEADGGGVTDVGAILRDITEQKQAEAERERLQRDAIEAQQQALKELATPIIPVMDRIIVVPLVGGLDSVRARDTMRALLTGITMYRAKIVILDITGVPIVDTGVAAHLNKTIQAARLKGAQTIVTGVSDAVAETIVDLGIDWGELETLSDLQTGLIVALRRMGFALNRV